MIVRTASQNARELLDSGVLAGWSVSELLHLLKDVLAEEERCRAGWEREIASVERLMADKEEQTHRIQELRAVLAALFEHVPDDVDPQAGLFPKGAR